MNGNGESRELPVLSDAEINTLYAICLAASQSTIPPFQALYDAYVEQFDLEGLDKQRDNKIFRWATEVGEQARRYYRDGQPTDFRPFVKSLFEAHNTQIEGLEEFEQSILSTPLQPRTSRPSRRVSFDNVYLEETWRSDELEPSPGRACEEELGQASRVRRDTPYRPRARSASSHGYIPSQEPAPRPSQHASPPSEYGSEEERSLVVQLKDPEAELMNRCEAFWEISDIRLARRCFQVWRERAMRLGGERLQLESQLYAVAVAKDRRHLLKDAFDEWHENFLARRRAAQERRAELEREAVLDAVLDYHLRKKDQKTLRDAFTHWLESTRYQREVVEECRMRLLKVRYFLRWRKLAVENALKARSMVMRKCVSIWRQKTARRQLLDEQAKAYFKESLAKRHLRQWMWLCRERRVEVWHENTVKRKAFTSWKARLQLHNDQEDQAYDQNETKLVTSSLRALGQGLTQRRESVVVAQDHQDKKLMASCYRALSIRAKLSPLATTLSIKVNLDLKRKALSILHLQFTLTRQAADIDRKRVLHSAWTVWNDKLRTRAIGQHIDQRILLESLYKWAIHTRARIFERVRGTRLLQRTFASWRDKLRTTTAALTQSTANFDASQRWRTLKYGMLRLNIAVRNHEDAARAATEFSNSRTLPDVLDIWRVRAEHVNKLGQWAVDARFYCLATRTLKIWGDRTEQHKQDRRKEAYAHIRARVKIRLARECLTSLHERAAAIGTQREQAVQVAQARTFAVGVQAFDSWREKTAALSSLAIQAQASDQQKLLTSALAALFRNREDLEDLESQAQRFRGETDQELLRSAVKRIQWSTFTAARRTETADALWARNRDQHIKHMLRHWAAQAAARKAARLAEIEEQDSNGRPEPDPDASPSLRPASRVAARSAERPLSRQQPLPARATPPSAGINLQSSTMPLSAAATPAYMRTPSRSRSRRANRFRPQLLPTPAPLAPMTFDRNLVIRTPASASASRFRQPPQRPAEEPNDDQGAGDDTDVFERSSPAQITPFARKLRQGGIASAMKVPPLSALRGAGTGLGRSFGGATGTGKSIIPDQDLVKNSGKVYLYCTLRGRFGTTPTPTTNTRAMEDDGRRSESPTVEPSSIVVRRARALTAPAKITFKETAPATSKPQDDTTTSDEPVTLDAEPDHRLYDADRIEVSYKWTCDRLDKRNITPRTGWALQMHQLRCLKALRHGVTDDLQREIQDFESTMDTESWLKAALPDDMYAMTQEVIALRWLQVLALVGDFVKMDCAKIREAARNMQREGVNLLSGRYQWTEISAKLKEEKLIHEKYGDARKDQTKTYRQVYEAARYAQLDFDEVCLCIHTYGQRNGVFHNDIEDKIREGYFSKLASTLYRTNQELYSLVPVEHQETADLLRRYFRKLRDRWFECYELDNPDTWQATEDLKQDRIKRRQSGESSVPSTPKKPSVAVPKLSPIQTDASTKYLQTPIAAPPHYRLPTTEQMPPAQNHRPAKRDLSENAPPSGREAKRSRNAAWQTVVHRDIELHNKQQEIENHDEVYAQLELGNMIADLRAVHGPDPPEDLKVEMEKLGVTEKSLEKK
ncbi:unnamed protein product [Zymoseptoria tritici ST99CH_3D1]|nr:unnamed protein product [Zymoseptoria tritici ST99CH_3D1]